MSPWMLSHRGVHSVAVRRLLVLALVLPAWALGPLDDLGSFRPTELADEAPDPKAAEERMRARLAERAGAWARAVAELGAADDASSTAALCETFTVATERAEAAEAERDRALALWRDCIVGYRPTMRRITWKAGREQAGLRFEADAAVLREFGHVLNALRAECAAHLRGRKAPESLAYIEGTVLPKGRSPHLRAEAAAIVRAPEPLLAALRREKDDGVRAAIVEALGRMEAALPCAAEVARLVADRSERVRIAAARALAEMHVYDGIGPLIRQLGKETGLSRSVMAQALESLTGERFGPFDDAWRKWWTVAEGRLRESGLPPRGEAPAPKADAHFYGVPQVSERIVYVIDVSDSMRANVAPGVSRLDACKQELERAVRALPRKASFNVILYNEGVEPWVDGVVVAGPVRKGDPDLREDAIRFFRLTVPHGTTNILDALREAFRIAGPGARKKDAPVLVDTIYLLTDGSPTDERGFPEDATRILRAVRRWNALGRVMIHTIGVGEDLNKPFLERLAKDNGGTFLHKGETGAPGAGTGGR